MGRAEQQTSITAACISLRFFTLLVFNFYVWTFHVVVTTKQYHEPSNRLLRFQEKKYILMRGIIVSFNIYKCLIVFIYQHIIYNLGLSIVFNTHQFVRQPTSSRLICYSNKIKLETYIPGVLGL